LNIPIQFSLPNLSSHSLNKFTCWYGQLQVIVIDEISLGVRLFNVIDNKLKSIKHIQNKCFDGVCVTMTYQTPPVKDNWIFQNIEDNVNALTPNF
jgi:hypothetical protein